MDRTADPYRDLDVIDARAPRFNQVTVGVVTLAALLTGWWPLVGLMGLQLVVGLTAGRRYCLPCVFYFEVIQPRFGEGPVEDARPPRFANIVGAAFLGASTAAHLAGLSTVGWVLAGIVSALALLAAATGLCVGCEIYRLMARVRGIRPGRVGRLDLSELDGLGTTPAGDVVVQFTHPLCTDCHEVERRLIADGHRLVLVDVSRRPDLARKYQVAVVPTALAVGGDGRVLQRLA
ncbi:MAG: DUF4395 family protein [Actinomycetota bacterium]